MDEAEQAARLAKLRELNAQTREALAGMASEFAAYDMEREFHEVLGHVSASLERNDALLGRMRPGHPGLGEALADMLANLERDREQVAGQQAKAEDVAEIGRVMECAGRFLAIVRHQQGLVRRLNRFSGAQPSRDMRLLATLGDTQGDIRRALITLRRDLVARAAELPAELPKLKSSAIEFADRIAELEIPPVMAKAGASASNQDGPGTHQNAKLALERLQELVTRSEGSPFGGMCRGGSDFRFEVKDMRETLQQLLAAMLGRGTGMGPARGAGGGGIGDIDDGFAMGGYSTLNTPVYGPDRARLVSPEFAGTGRALNTDGAGAGAGRAQDGSSETMRLSPKDEPSGRSMPLERVPEKYREAVKRYFGEE
jgi:hypothetical protein